MKSIWVPISGQIAQQNKIETIANNIANVNTAGFKKDDTTFKEYLAAVEQPITDIDIPRKDWSNADMYRTQGGQNAFVLHDSTYTDFQQGTLQNTSQPLDVGLFGKGFFEVQTPTGIRYTRKGNLGLDQEGRLVTQQGFPVLAPPKNLDPAAPPDDITKRYIKIDPAQFNKHQLSINEKGEIFNLDQKVESINIVKFNDLNAIKKEGPFFVNTKVNNIVNQDPETLVKQGYLEGSNVNAITEMSELIKAHRQFDNLQKAISTYDNIMGRAVNDISKY